MFYMCNICHKYAHRGACELTPEESEQLAAENFWQEWRQHVYERYN